MEITHWFNPAHIIEQGGVSILCAIVLLETGVFFGFFLPGDSLLFSAGMMCSLGVIDVPVFVLIGGLILASVVGTWLGFVSGKYFMPYLIGEKGIFRLNERYLDKARQFYRRYGNKALVIGKFFPVIRTFTPILAGVLHIPNQKFMLLNAMGSFIWVTSLVGSGYYLGSLFPWLANYLWIIVLVLILATLAPLLPSFFHKKNKTAQRSEN